MPDYSVENKLTRFPEPSEAQMRSILMSLKNGKSPGSDGLQAQTLKTNVEFFLPVVTHLTALVCRTGRFPSAVSLLIDASCVYFFVPRKGARQSGVRVYQRGRAYFFGPPKNARQMESACVLEGSAYFFVPRNDMRRLEGARLFFGPPNDAR